jgi:hypothetical protein
MVKNKFKITNVSMMIKLTNILNEIFPKGAGRKISKALQQGVKPGDVFQDYYKKGVEIAIEKSMGKWRTVSFDLKTMSAHEVGVNNTLEKQKPMKLSSSDKMKIKKIVKDPQESHFINQGDSNMVKKLLRVLR